LKLGIHTFLTHSHTWTYTGEGFHEKAITRFNKLLLIESKQMDIKFLTKQLLLMSNIAKTYRNKVHSKVWKKLHDLFMDTKGLPALSVLPLKSVR